MPGAGEYQEIFKTLPQKEDRTEPTIDTYFEIGIPESYMPEQTDRLSFYTALYGIKNLEEMDELKEEMEDRFGPVPALVKRLLMIATLAVMSTYYEIQNAVIDWAVERGLDRSTSALYVRSLLEGLAAGGRHVRGPGTKRLLREVARHRLPPFILRRRKRGLSVPVGRWLNGPLAGLANRLLTAGRLIEAGLVDAPTVVRLVREHRAGRANHGRALWTLLVTQHWMAHWNLEIER